MMLPELKITVKKKISSKTYKKFKIIEKILEQNPNVKIKQSALDSFFAFESLVVVQKIGSGGERKYDRK